MEETGRRHALAALQSAHKHLLLAMKHLAGERIPMGGLQFDLASAIKDLRAVQSKTTEAIQSIGPHVAR